MILHRVAGAVRPASRRPNRTSRRRRPDYRHQLRAAELSETLTLVPTAAIAPAGVAAALVPVFWTHPLREPLIAMALCICLICLVAMAAVRRYKPHLDMSASIERGRYGAAIVAALLGAAWGAIPVILFAASDPWQRLIVLAALAATMADVFLLGTILSVCVAFLVPLLMGACLGIARAGNPGTAVLLGLMVCLACVVIAALRRQGRLAARRIGDGLLADDLDETIDSLLLNVDEKTSDWTFDLDPARRLRGVSGVVAKAAGQTIDELEGARFVSLFRGGRAVRAAIAERQPFRDELVDIATDGTQIWWRVSGKPVYDHSGAFLGYRGVGTDITEARRAEERIAYLASFDPLTSLANRGQFQAHVTRECEAAATDGHWRALLYMDLDGFKTVNDSFGHAAGDALLKDVAQRLRTCIPPGALLARLGGDEFAIWLTTATPARAETLADAIIEFVNTPFDLYGTPISIGVSIGIAFTPKHGVDPDILLGRADLALYRAKAEGKGSFRVFVEAYELSLIERRKLQSDLQLAIARQEFELHYQPLVDLTYGTIVGFEALIRWQSPTRGFVSPADFVPAAEVSGHIHAIGHWVLMQACKDAAAWPDNISIAINVSPQQVRTPDFAQTVFVALRASGLPPTRLEIEVTEGVFLDASPAAMSNLRALRARGIRIALDDFGTGYSSLSYLINFPVDKIKIDRSFVRDCATRHENQTIVDAILTIARKLSIHVTAEGVETVEQALALKSRRCDDIQGYLFSKPRPLADVPAMFEAIPRRFQEIFPLGFESPLGLALAMKKQSA